ncbi:hypothetical protein ACFLZ5_08400 [Thermodesulfobacteriota bacterium]
MNKEQVDELIQLLLIYELSIAELYENFAALFPSAKKNWLAYAKEERLHAKWIETLHTRLKNEKISFEQTKITVQSTRIAIDFIEKQIAKAKKSETDLKQAVTIAVDIEKSLLESAFFNIFKLSSPKAINIQSRLVEATKIHIKKLIEWQATLENS